MPKTDRRPPAPAYRCTECGWETGKWVGRCGECQAWGSVAEGSAPHPAGRGRPGDQPGGADRRGLGRGVDLPQQRRARARPGARRRPGPRRGDPAGRRARRRQEHPAARGGRPDRPLPAPHALRHRRGVGVPGAAARRPHRRRAPRALPRRRDRPRRRTHPHRAGPADAAGRRLDPDHRRLGHRGRARRGHPGQGGRGRADPGRQDPQHHHRARRPRHQGRLDRRSAGARAPRRRGAALRGRPQLPVPDGARDEEPVRPDRRGRLLRPRPPTASSRSPTRPGCSSSTRPAGSPAPASR